MYLIEKFYKLISTYIFFNHAPKLQKLLNFFIDQKLKLIIAYE